MRKKGGGWGVGEKELGRREGGGGVIKYFKTTNPTVVKSRPDRLQSRDFFLSVKLCTGPSKRDGFSVADPVHFYEVVQIRILKFAKVPIRSLFIIMCVKLLFYINEIV